MINNLKALAAVIDNKSLTKAAPRLSLTQSAISRRIQQLEETVGGALLDRNQRPPSPTALGRRVYEQSLPILRAVADLISLTRKMRRRPAPCGSACRKRSAMSSWPTRSSTCQGSSQRSTFACAGAGATASLPKSALAIWMPRSSCCRPATRPEAPPIGRNIATIDVAIVQAYCDDFLGPHLIITLPISNLAIAPTIAELKKVRDWINHIEKR
jgi:hypothetical protein